MFSIFFSVIIGNLSVSQLIAASVRLLMVRQRRTQEGELIPHQIYDMELTHLHNGQLFFPRPTFVEHVINSRSPLFGVQRATLNKEHFEIIAIIEGAFDHTGFSCHFRTSYLPNEVVWGYAFASCDSTLSGFDYRKFNELKIVYARPYWIYDNEPSSDCDSPKPPVSNYSSHFTTFDITIPTKVQAPDVLVESPCSPMSTIESCDTDDEHLETKPLRSSIVTSTEKVFFE